MSLCEDCKVLSTAWLVPRLYDLLKYPNDTVPKYWWLKPSWNALKESGVSCNLCALILQESSDVKYRSGEAQDTGGIRLQAFGGGRVDVQCIEAQKEATLYLALDDESIERVSDETRFHFPAKIVTNQPEEEGNIKSIQQWIATCKSSHTKCAKWGKSIFQGSRRLPTRVLAVGLEQDDSVQLCVPENSDVSDYVTLSYCWGKGPVSYPTKLDTIDAYLNSIPLASLPKTIRDAIVLTRKLQIKYLWVDALCIVQDDDEDWARESSLMHKVYAQSLFTLSADAATDTNMGILKERSGAYGQKVRLPWPPQPTDLKGGPIRLYAIPDVGRFSESIKNSPLNARAWVFQEQALSARMLHVGSDLIYFQCKQSAFAENTRSDLGNLSNGFSRLRDMMLASESTHEMPSIELHDKWSWVIEEYTKRNLTVPGDKLPALAGVASIFSEKKKLGSYLCGLWQEELLRHLLWQCDRSATVPVLPKQQQQQQQHVRSVEYRAPTWSWVSIDGPITNPAIQTGSEVRSGGLRIRQELGRDELLTHKILEIRSVAIQAQNNQFGRVASAVLKAQSIVRQVTLGPKLGEGLYALQQPDGSTVGIAIWDVEGEVEQAAAKGLWICPVMQWKRVVDGWHMSECLLLVPAADEPSGGEGKAFVRVGKGSSTNWWLDGAVKECFSIL